MKLFSGKHVNTDQVAIENLLSRSVAEVIDEQSMRKKLSSGKVLRVKLGIDPTSPNIHLGRAVVLRKLRDFQNMGHHIIFLIGDFTGTIGDTSDKDAERPMIDPEVVRKNMSSYTKQASKILDIKKVEVVYNSTWLKKLQYKDICDQAEVFSVNDFISRELVSKRLKEGKRVSLREVLYPLMQGYDSVKLKADIEIGGTDQRFNLLAGRTLQKKYNQQPQDVLMVNLIDGTDGRKMSSSWGNVITLTDTPTDMFGKVMKVRDELIVNYFVNCTDASQKEIETITQALESGINPRDLKLELAHAITTIYHGAKLADGAKQDFISAFSKDEMPNDAQVIKVSEGQKLIDVLVSNNIVSSKTDARRLFSAGAIKAVEKGPDAIFDDPNTIINTSLDLRVGKHRFVKIVLKDQKD